MSAKPRKSLTTRGLRKTEIPPASLPPEQNGEGTGTAEAANRVVETSQASSNFLTQEHTDPETHSQGSFPTSESSGLEVLSQQELQSGSSKDETGEAENSQGGSSKTSESPETKAREPASSSLELRTSSGLSQPEGEFPASPSETVTSFQQGSKHVGNKIGQENGAQKKTPCPQLSKGTSTRKVAFAGEDSVRDLPTQETSCSDFSPSVNATSALLPPQQSSPTQPSGDSSKCNTEQGHSSAGSILLLLSDEELTNLLIARGQQVDGLSRIKLEELFLQTSNPKRATSPRTLKPSKSQSPRGKVIVRRSKSGKLHRNLKSHTKERVSSVKGTVTLSKKSDQAQETGPVDTAEKDIREEGSQVRPISKRHSMAPKMLTSAKKYPTSAPPAIHRTISDTTAISNARRNAAAEAAEAEERAREQVQDTMARRSRKLTQFFGTNVLPADERAIPKKAPSMQSSTKLAQILGANVFAVPVHANLPSEPEHCQRQSSGRCGSLDSIFLPEQCKQDAAPSAKPLTAMQQFNSPKLQKFFGTTSLNYPPAVENKKHPNKKRRELSKLLRKK